MHNLPEAATLQRVSARIGTIRQRPFTCYSFDCIVLNEPDEHGNRHILVVIDELFQSGQAVSDGQSDGGNVVAGHLHDVFCRWGRPHEVRCDNAKSFLVSNGQLTTEDGQDQAAQDTSLQSPDEWSGRRHESTSHVGSYVRWSSTQTGASEHGEMVTPAASGQEGYHDQNDHSIGVHA